MADITIDQLATQTFYQVPEIFFSRVFHVWNDEGKVIETKKLTSSYVTLSSDAKLAYGILYKRCQLSINSYQKGNRDYVDENGSVFMVFKVEELMLLLDKSKMTVTKIKKELQEHGLLREVRQGVNKPNRLYLQLVNANLEITEIYDADHTLVKKLNAFGQVIFQKEESQPEVAQTLDTSGSPNFGRPENGLLEVQNLYPIKRDKSYRDNKDDTNRYREEPSLTPLSQSEAFQMGDLSFLSEDSVKTLAIFGSEAKGLTNKIFQAKRFVEKSYPDLVPEGERIYGEHWARDLDGEVRRLVFKVKTGQAEGKPIQDVPAYFYTMMVRFWKLALLIETEQGFVNLDRQCELMRQEPETYPSLVAYYRPEKLAEVELNGHLATLSLNRSAGQSARREVRMR